MINEGIFKNGSRLPSEPELAKSLGVSRTTLRQALALLQDDGLIKNIQGKGNFIIKTSSKKNCGLETVDNPVYKCINENIYEIIITDYPAILSTTINILATIITAGIFLSPIVIIFIIKKRKQTKE